MAIAYLNRINWGFTVKSLSAMDNALTSILSDSHHSDNKKAFISKNIITFPFLENQLPAAGMNQLFFLYFHLLGH